MNSMQDFQSLIKKFWAGTASPEEQRRLAELMNSHEKELRRMLEDEYRQHMEETLSYPSAVRSEELLQRIHAQMEEKQEEPVRAAKVVVLRKPIRWIAAAALAGGIGWGIYHWVGGDHGSPGGGGHPANAVARMSPAVKDGGYLQWQVNKGAVAEQITLPDGSVAELYPGSRLSSVAPFGSDQAGRELMLEGKAKFSVAKRAGAPFRVNADGLTTTALGTSFIVNTLMTHRVSVVLLEGRVVVHATEQSGVSMRDIYLHPGQELAVNTLSASYAVNKWDTSAGHSSRATTPSYVFTFDRTPLAKVFRQLSQHYHTSINFNDQDMAGLSFTGKILPTDDLSIVLSVICNTNDLTCRSDKGTINISKQP